MKSVLEPLGAGWSVDRTNSGESMFFMTCSRKAAFHGAAFDDFVSAATVADIALVM